MLHYTITRRITHNVLFGINVTILNKSNGSCHYLISLFHDWYIYMSLVS